MIIFKRRLIMDLVKSYLIHVPDFFKNYNA